MAYVHFNPNPFRLTTDDCTVKLMEPRFYAGILRKLNQ